MPIWNWVGLVLFAIGTWFLTAALRRRRRALTAWRAARANGQNIEVLTSQKFAAAATVIRLIIHTVLFSGAVAAILFYQASGASGLAALLDLLGVLVLLAGYGAWASIRTRYRDISPAAVVARGS